MRELKIGAPQPELSVVAPLHNEGGIRHDDVDARRGFLAEGDAKIDHQPFAGVAIEIEIHPDLAAATKRQEEQLVAGPVDHLEFRR